MVVAMQQQRRHSGDFRIAEVPQRGIGPARADFDAAGEHVDHRRTTGRQPQVDALGETRAARGLEELHLAGQLVGVVVRLLWTTRSSQLAGRFSKTETKVSSNSF